MNVADDPFRVEQLRELCDRQAVATPRELLERIFATAREFCPRAGAARRYGGDAVSISRARSGLSAAETLVERAPHVEDAHGAGLFN